MIWKVSVSSARSTEWGVGPSMVDSSMVGWIGGSKTVDPLADSALVSSILGMVESCVSWSNESTGGLNSSDSRISVDRMKINNISLMMINITTLSLSQSTFKLKKLNNLIISLKWVKLGESYLDKYVWSNSHLNCRFWKEQALFFFQAYSFQLLKLEN